MTDFISQLCSAFDCERPALTDRIFTTTNRDGHVYREPKAGAWDFVMKCVLESAKAQLEADLPIGLARKVLSRIQLQMGEAPTLNGRPLSSEKAGGFILVSVRDEDPIRTLEREFDQALQKIVAAEDAQLLQLIDVAGTSREPIATHQVQDLFEKTRGATECVGLGAYLISRAMMAPIVRHMSTVVDPETQRESVLAGKFGMYRGMPIYAASSGHEDLVGRNAVIAVAAPANLGVFFQTLTPFVEFYKSFMGGVLHYGIALCELNAMGLCDPQAVVVGHLSQAEAS